MAMRYPVVLVPELLAITMKMRRTMPTTTLIIVQSRACFEERSAPSKSPALFFEEAWEAKTIDTIPVGRQQKSVTRIAGIR
jgi:hypothetical protein